jgi:hypothetical protein
LVSGEVAPIIADARNIIHEHQAFSHEPFGFSDDVPKVIHEGLGIYAEGFSSAVDPAGIYAVGFSSVIDIRTFDADASSSVIEG